MKKMDKKMKEMNEEHKMMEMNAEEKLRKILKECKKVSVTDVHGKVNWKRTGIYFSFPVSMSKEDHYVSVDKFLQEIVKIILEL